MLGMHMGRVPNPCGEDAEHGIAAFRHDTYFWLQQINRASAVANSESGLLEKPLAADICRALLALDAEAAQPGAARPDLYITFEPQLLERCGMRASVLHVGRSSQDILATANASLNIERLMQVSAALNDVVNALLALAEREIDAVVPAYTNGVQAQPTLYAHYLLAQASIFSRDIERIGECIRRYDLCPMGSCVCNGTGWPLNSSRMSELLGFATPAANAFDAGQCIGNDLPLEFSQIVSSAMIHVNAFLADFMVQYAVPHPWIRLASTNGVYRSSAMPQKRNPGLVNDCRRDAGVVASEALSLPIRLQNLQLGMADARDANLLEAFGDDACVVLRTFAGIVRSLEVDHERALAELNSDWTCTQEIADRLVRLGGIDFRSGHRFASTMVTWARQKGATPLNVTYADAQSLWKSFIEDKEALPKVFPLSEDAFMSALNPMGILEERATIGSANPKLVAASLEAAKRSAAEREAALDAKIAARREALERLDAEVRRLIEANPAA